MAIYIYKTKSTSGNIEKGKIEAGDKYKAVDMLQAQGFIVLSLNEAKDVFASQQAFKKKRLRARVKTDDLSSFARQLATLLDSGVPLLRSLEIVKDQAEVKPLRIALEKIVKDIEAGESLSAAISKYPRIFSSFWANLIASGETSGQLPYVLVQLTQYMESTASLQRKIVSALIYPAILTIAAIIALFVFVTTLIPMFGELYAYFGSKLPLLTQIIIDTSYLLKKGLPVLVPIVILGAVFMVRFFGYTERGAMYMDIFKIRCPLIRILYLNVILHRFSNGLAMMLKSGVPILYSLEVIAKAVANRIYEAVIIKAREKVKEGDSLGATLESFPKEFPLFVTNMIKIGEESGNLPNMLAHISEYYNEKVNTIVTRLPYIIEPLILLTIGAVIGIIVIAMFLPIFGLSSAVQI